MNKNYKILVQLQRLIAYSKISNYIETSYESELSGVN